MSLNVLITGGCGFIGSSIALFLKKQNTSYTIYCLDNLYRKGSEHNTSRLAKSGINVIEGDIRYDNHFDKITSPIDLVIHAAAEPSVSAGINNDVDYVIDTNLYGTVNTLKFAQKNNAKLIFISTSRIYSIKQLQQITLKESSTRFEIAPQQIISGITLNGIDESFSTIGYKSFYGTTKLSSEALIEEYGHFYGLNYIINRCGLVAGPWQMGKADQGIITYWLKQHLLNKELKYIGYEGKQVRDVLHVQDLCLLIDMQINTFSAFNNSIFNIGGGIKNSTSLIELTKFCNEELKLNIPIEKIDKVSAADIPLYISDNSKIESTANWKPTFSIKDTLFSTFDWLKESKDILQ